MIDGVIIGYQVVAVEYIDDEKAKLEGIKNPKNKIWRHEFEIDDVELIGLPDGSVLLKSRSGKRLWDFV